MEKDKLKVISMSKNITNVIFFLRHEEPRIEELDLFDCMCNQIRTANEFDFPATYLLEYDSLIDERFPAYLKANINDKSEIGGWFEIVKQLCDKAGIEWRGREGYNWDWHCYCGFSVGYTQDERKRLVDTYMKDFYDIFGYYPKSVGSWLIDAFSLKYMEDKYGVVASCNCRDQWGTDGYTLWGGYYGQGYYPSRYNVLCPAQTKENQINIPVFRMLGIDYMHQYDFNLSFEDGTYNNKGAQHAMTLEPVYCRGGYGGGHTGWTDWYLEENFPETTLSFNYVHVGQENSFLWSDQEKGTLYQFNKLKALEAEGKMEMLTLSETGEWYKATYPLTPASSVKADSDWREGFDCKTMWYNCRNYRSNLYSNYGRTWIRDLFLYREDYTERYYDDVCTTTYMTYDNLPVVDGCLNSGNGVRAGLYISLVKNKREKDLAVAHSKRTYTEDGKIIVTMNCVSGDVVTLTFAPDGITLACDTAQVRLCQKNDATKKLPFKSADGKSVSLEHNSYAYSFSVEGATVSLTESGFVTEPSNLVKLVLA